MPEPLRKRFIVLALIASLSSFLVGGCTSFAEDDTLASPNDPAAEGAPPVAGAATPRPDDHGNGWW